MRWFGCLWPQAAAATPPKSKPAPSTASFTVSSDRPPSTETMPAGRSTSTLAAASRAVIALVTERTQPPQVIPETLYFVAIINPPFGVLVIGYSALGIWRAGIGLDQPLGW